MWKLPIFVLTIVALCAGAIWLLREEKKHARLLRLDSLIYLMSVVLSYIPGAMACSWLGAEPLIIIGLFIGLVVIMVSTLGAAVLNRNP